MLYSVFPVSQSVPWHITVKAEKGLVNVWIIWSRSHDFRHQELSDRVQQNRLSETKTGLSHCTACWVCLCVYVCVVVWLSANTASLEYLSMFVFAEAILTPNINTDNVLCSRLLSNVFFQSLYHHHFVSPLSLCFLISHPLCCFLFLSPSRLCVASLCLLIFLLLLLLFFVC